jgi:outer membrane protein assembly factor BamB
MTSEKQTYTRRALLASGATGALAGCQAPAPPRSAARLSTTAGGDGTTREERQFDPNGAFWPMEGYDAGNTKHAPDAEVPAADEQWRVTGATEQGDVLGTPAVADGVLFIGNGYRMLGLDVSSGKLRWDRTLDLQVAFYSPAIHDDAVLVPGVSMESGSNGLYAFDAGDGTTNWRVETPITSSPVVVEGTAYVSVDGSDGKTLSGRSVEDGTEQLAVEFEAVDAGARFAPKPAVVDETIYLPVRGIDEEDTSTLLALDTADGGERWRRPLTSEVHSAPVVADGRVYVGTVGGEVVALDGASGEVVWTTDSVQSVRQSPCIADGTLYVVDVDGVVHALGTRDGHERWTVNTAHPHQTRPVVSNGVVVLSGSTIIALDATDGQRRWEFNLSNMASSGFTPAALLDGAIAVASCTKSDNSQRLYDNNVHLL